jgi:hypothetical protein
VSDGYFPKLDEIKALEILRTMARPEVDEDLLIDQLDEAVPGPAEAVQLAWATIGVIAGMIGHEFRDMPRSSKTFFGVSFGEDPRPSTRAAGQMLTAKLNGDDQDGLTIGRTIIYRFTDEGQALVGSILRLFRTAALSYGVKL